MESMSTRIFSYLPLSNTIWMQFMKHLKDFEKIRAVKQHESETINTFYHCILHLGRQCQFEKINVPLIDAIVCGCKSKKAQDKLLQMPMQMMIEECLLICRHYESF